MSLGHAIVLAAAVLAWHLLACDAATEGRLSPAECLRLYAVGSDAGGAEAGPIPEECVEAFEMMSSSACGQLIRQTCGESGGCAETGSCIAAQLMAERDDGEERCQTSIDTSELSPCVPDTENDPNCDALLLLICGGAAHDFMPCAGQPTCQQALLLHRAADDTACRQALSEESLFPRCSG